MSRKCLLLSYLLSCAVQLKFYGFVSKQNGSVSGLLLLTSFLTWVNKALLQAQALVWPPEPSFKSPSIF